MTAVGIPVPRVAARGLEQAERPPAPPAPVPDGSVWCALRRVDGSRVADLEPVFYGHARRIVLDLAEARSTTTEGIARLAMLVRRAKGRSVSIEVVAARPRVRKRLMAAGLHHLVVLSD